MIKVTACKRDGILGTIDCREATEPVNLDGYGYMRFCNLDHDNDCPLQKVYILTQEENQHG